MGGSVDWKIVSYGTTRSVAAQQVLEDGRR